MKTIGKTILTRKAFLDLAGMEDDPETCEVIFIESKNSRWIAHTNAVKNIDKCLLPSSISGFYVCLSVDASKAKRRVERTTAKSAYVSYKQSDLSTVKNIEESLKCVLDNYKDLNLIYFENLPLILGDIDAADFIDVIKIVVPPEVRVVVTLQKENTTDELWSAFNVKEKADIHLKANLQNVEVVRSKSEFNQFEYIHTV